MVLDISYCHKLCGRPGSGLWRVGLTPAFTSHTEAPNIKKAIALDTLFDITKALEIPAYQSLPFGPGDV